MKWGRIINAVVAIVETVATLAKKRPPREDRPPPGYDSSRISAK